MSVRTLTANGDLISLTTPFGGITPGYPMTVAMWVNLLAGNQIDFYSWTLTSNSNSGWEIGVNSTNHLYCGVGNLDQAPCVNTVTLGTWYYCIARFISATSRRFTVLQPNTIENIQNVTSDTPPSGDNENILCWRGSGGPSTTTGMVAEAWRTNSDIQPDGAVLQTPMLIQLAYKGPWSIPAVAEKIVWYKSFRQSVLDTVDTIDDPSFARNGRAGWTKAGGTSTLAQLVDWHPPLASDYVYLNTLKPTLYTV